VPQAEPHLPATRGDDLVGGGELGVLFGDVRGLPEYPPHIRRALLGNVPMPHGQVLDSCPGYSLSSAARFEDMANRAAELGFTDVIVHFPRADGV
jgi:hypothetical protein